LVTYHRDKVGEEVNKVVVAHGMVGVVVYDMAVVVYDKVVVVYDKVVGGKRVVGVQQKLPPIVP
jgi:hypothetical protein